MGCAMSAKLMIERDGFDLREAMDWCDWLEYLSFEDREVFEQACVHYVCAEDALVLLFSHQTHLEIGDDGFARAVQSIGNFYQERREDWIMGLSEIGEHVDVPRYFITPLVRIEVAPPADWMH